MIITRAIGIDLGTTNSAVAMLELDDQNIYLFSDAQGRSTIPSCLWENPRTGEIVIGHRAYVRKGTKPEPVTSIKRSMGTQITVALGDKQQTPAEISSHLLKELKKYIATGIQSKAKEGSKYELSHAIITVPAYFSLPAIEATRQAGELAGIEVTELLHEPTAAAIYYCWKHDLGDGIYLVYDLGGGTFDVSVLQRTSGEFLVLGISGDNFLGGDDFDRRLAEHIKTLLVADGYDLNLDVNADPEDQLRFNQLMTLAERSKKELSSKDEFILRDQGILKDKSGAPVIVEVMITRPTFEKIIDDLLDRTIDCCKKAMAMAHEKSGITMEDVDNILLVGGSTYVPAVTHKVRQALCMNVNNADEKTSRPKEPIRDEPENAVALGAALRAAASGLGLGDDNRRIRIWFQGSNITKRKQANISGYIEPLQNGLNIEGGFIRIKNIDGEDLGEVQLKQGLRFVFPKLSLQAESLNEFQFEVLDSDEKQIAVLNRSIAHAADSKETVGSTLSTSVLPKPIILEGTDGDRLVRQVLLEEGASLPATAKFTFAVNDPSGRIRLPIFQESRIIKELQADVGKIVVGTPVQIEIGCDEQVNIQVKFSIGQKQFGGTIAPPPPDAVPTEYEIRQITNDFNDAIKPLDDEDMLRLQSLYKRTYEDMVEARSGADYPKVIQKAKELEGLVRQARIAAPLKPPLDTLEKNYAKCIDLISNTDDLKSKVNIKLLRENLDEAVTVGRKAYKIRERESYNDAVQVINTSLQFLINLRRTQGANIKDMDSAMQALMLLDECRGMARFLSVHCLIHRQTGYLQDTKAKLDELNVLEKSVESDSVRVINRCQVLVTEMRRIYKEITPDDRMAKELGGLLNVDSATRSLNIGKTKGFANEL